MEHGISNNTYTSWVPNPDMECPGCGNVSFEHTDTLIGDGKRTLEYKCECGELQYFNESRDEYPGFDQFLRDFGMDALDNLSPIERLQVAYAAGRLYEVKKEREKLKRTVEFLSQAG